MNTVLKTVLGLTTLFLLLGAAMATQEITTVGLSGGNIIVTDRTGATVYSQAAGSSDQTAINYAMNTAYNDNGPVYIQPGTYVTSGTITQTKQMRVSGSGKASTIIDARHSGVIWQMGTVSTSSIVGDLNDLTMQRGSSYRTQNGNVGLYIPAGGNINEANFHATGWDFAHITDVKILYSDKNVLIGTPASSLVVSQPVAFDTCQIGAWDDKSTYCVDDEGAFQLRFTNCNIWGFSGSGSAGFYSNYLKNDVWIDNCYIATAAVRYGYTAGAYGVLFNKGIVARIDNNQFENAGTANIAIHESVDSTILGNNIGGFGGTGAAIIVEPTQGDVLNTRIIGNCVNWYSSSMPGILVYKNGAAHTIKGTTIVGNTIDVLGPAGIDVLDAFDTAMSGNVIKADKTPNNANGLYLAATSAYSGANIAAAGNSIDMGGSTGTYYGIQVQNPNVNNFGWRTFVANTIYPSAGTAISPAGNTADQIEADNKVA